ncbi:hypothetical protein FIBSPDRAFT_1038729 [Athelia psychrophila]|uniref:Uncharacterized protein n=1 Tax=Athelia psychrophila TaxID=1759441 RepID=A0A166SPP2_9AGAM|nr:hypothetical protein FIBSPDRAFT_1038729 [Fibularhizoctonia sp. CBS 109695]
MVPPRHRPSDNSEARGGAAADSMSEADAKKCLDQDLKEFFAVRDLDEVEHYVQMLMPEHRFRLVDQKAFLSQQQHTPIPGWPGHYMISTRLVHATSAQPAPMIHPRRTHSTKAAYAPAISYTFTPGPQDETVMPMSPQNPQMLSQPGTPTPALLHQPLHSNNGSISSIASPPSAMPASQSTAASSKLARRNV